MAASGDARAKLRVCFFIPDFGYGGAQKQCILLLNELQRRDDVELTLIRFRPGEQAHLLDTDRLRDERLSVRSNYDLRAIVAAGRLLSDCQADVVMSWVRVCDIYTYFIRLRHPRIKWVMTQRNSHHAHTMLRRVRDRLGRRADAIAANSPGGVQWWKDRHARGSVHLVDNIAAPAQIAPSKRVPRSVLFVGRLEPQKNVLTMIKAFALVAQAHTDVKIWVCGDGTQRAEMENAVAEAGVGDRIEFLGFRKDATDWMARALVLVSLSDHEGMPNVLMEGVQADCTIVASAITEHIDFLGPTYPFLVQNHHNVDQVVDVLMQALSSPGDPHDLEHARRHLARMEPANVAAQYMEIFRSVTSPEPISTARD